MANHGFITFRKNIKPDELLSYFQEINLRRFKGKLVFDKSQYAERAWYINYPNWDDGNCGFNIWITSPKKLEFRHPFQSWAKYLRTVYTEELSHEASGIISDEGISDKWKGEPSKYPSLDSYVEDMNSFAKEKSPMLFKQIRAMELEAAPPELRDC